MMFHPQGAVRRTCRLLAVTSEDLLEHKWKKDNGEEHLRYPFPELHSSGRLEVRSLENPSKAEFSKVVESYRPNLIYLRGALLDDDEIGSLSWRGVDLSTVEVICDLFSTPFPTTVYLEIPNGEELAKALHSKGIPYVIYWKNTFSRYAASHFCNAFLSVVQSSSAHAWDAFQLAHASFRLYCSENNNLHLRNEHEVSDDFCPQLLGERLKIKIEPSESDMAKDEEDSLGTLPAVNIYADDVGVKFLVCGEPSKLDAYLLRALEDGLSALLNIEIRGSKLHGKFSAPPPPLQAEMFSPGVVTMKCDISTCTCAHIALLLSGSAQTCFDDQLLENHIKKEIIENSQPVHALTDCEESKVPLSEPRKSASVACGAAVFEVGMKVPNWASQILRQLAPDISYRSLVALGIACIQGVPVASFERYDADRLLYFRSKPGQDKLPNDSILYTSPSWLKPPAPTRKRSKPGINGGFLGSLARPNMSSARIDEQNKDMALMYGSSTSLLPAQQRSKIPAMRSIPRLHRHKMTIFSGSVEANGHDRGQIKPKIAVATPPKHIVVRSTSGPQQKSFPSSSHFKQMISLNPLPLKKHGCGRNPIHDCSENSGGVEPDGTCFWLCDGWAPLMRSIEDFLKDVLQFMVERGHTRLVPPGGLSEFPDAILNGKRLDLYNLYKEVVSRGGFRVGNGINWKGQIFSKMSNYTMSNKMTGAGNTLKRHYETYLLEYELAHDDVDGECCLLCHSNAAGDWVNCGICGEWAHFGCDGRQGLGAFKDYAKTAGLDYICPHCSNTSFKRRPQNVRNGFTQSLLASQPFGD